MSYRLSLSVIAASLLTLLATNNLQAQTLDDVLRFSEVSTLGTARSLGIGNSNAAIGAEWTAVQGNPAGLANYRTNEATLTMGGLIRGTSESTLQGDVANSGDTDFKFALPQLALVFTSQPIGSRWTQINFGLGVSQTNRFEENIAFRGTTAGSITDAFLEEANGFYVDPALGTGTLNEIQSPAAVAYRADVLVGSDQSAFPDFYSSDYDAARTDASDPGPALAKRAKVERTGHAASFDFSFGANYEDRLQLGVTVGVVSSSFEEINRYVENDAAGNVPIFDNLDYRRTQQIDATGVLGRVGAIYRFSQAFRLGLAYHSPTYSSVTDNLSQDIQYDFTDGSPRRGSGQTIQADVLEYNIITPSQYRVSAGGVIGRKGFISADVGYINYPGAKVRYGDDVPGGDAAEEALDAVIAENLQSAIQARLGAEVNLLPIFLRAGFEYYGAPVVDEEASFAVAAGVGFRKNRFSLDGGYRLTIRPDRVYRPYNILSNATLPADEQFPVQQVDYTPTLSTFVVTAGWKLTRLTRGED